VRRAAVREAGGVTAVAELGVRRGLSRTLAQLAREERHLAEIMKIRFHPFVLDRADGCLVHDVDGNEYLDFVAAGAVMNVGYRNAAVEEAIERALAGPWSTTSAIYAHEAQTALAERLSALIPVDTKTWFGTSGSEAMDTIGRYFRTASGKPRLLSFVGAFHGQTGGSSALSGLPSHEDTPSDYVTRVPFPYPYRCPHGPCDVAGCSLTCLEPVERALDAGASELAGIVLEPIQSDGGDVIPPANVLPELRRLADEHGVWLAVDEVKIGLARTGRMLASDHAGIVPDAVGLGKALGGGLPISAVVARREILDVRVGTCAYTLAGSPAPAAAALATLDEIERGDLAARAAAQGRRLLDGLRELAAHSPIVGDVRGLGLIAGVELVEDRESRSPAPTAAACAVYRCFELGLLLIYTGASGNVLELTPPLMIGDAEVDAALAILERALGDVAAGRFDDAKLAPYRGW
jgi:4-aminobutyrate aminotransferase